jgi:hypothetical protein
MVHGEEQKATRRKGGRGKISKRAPATKSRSIEPCDGVGGAALARCEVERTLSLEMRGYRMVTCAAGGLHCKGNLARG